MWDKGCRPPTQKTGGHARCFCGETITNTMSKPTSRPLTAESTHEARQKPLLRQSRDAVRKLVELAVGIPSLQFGRIPIEEINGPFLVDLKAAGSEFGAGLGYAIEKGWLEVHESGLREAAETRPA